MRNLSDIFKDSAAEQPPLQLPHPPPEERKDFDPDPAAPADLQPSRPKRKLSSTGERRRRKVGKRDPNKKMRQDTLAAGIASAAMPSPPIEREVAACGSDGLAFLELSEAGNSS